MSLEWPSLWLIALLWLSCTRLGVDGDEDGLVVRVELTVSFASNRSTAVSESFGDAALFSASVKALPRVGRTDSSTIAGSSKGWIAYFRPSWTSCGLSMSSSVMKFSTISSCNAALGGVRLCVEHLNSEGLLTSWSFVTELSLFPFPRTNFDQIDLMVFFIPFRRGGYIISLRGFEPGKVYSPHVEMISAHFQVGFEASAPPFVIFEAWKALSRHM